jgi:tRNA-dihydrouridine synthase A
MKREFPDMVVSINGGVTTLAQAADLLAQGLDGVMVGRAAYHDPYGILAGADALICGGGPAPTREAVVAATLPVIAAHLAAGGRLHQISRHMLGLFAGQPGARAWRRTLSEEGGRHGAGTEVVLRALAAVTERVADVA